MSRKRDKPYNHHHHHPNPSRHAPAPKRRRPHPAAAAEEEEVVDLPITKAAPPPALVVMGLGADCSVLDLKSRFEIYGSISRIRIERDCVGVVAFRTRDSAEAAIAASLDPSFGISVHSHKLQVMWSTDPLAQWRQGVGVGAGKDNNASVSASTSKLIRPEVPLSRHGRGNKLASTIVSPRSGGDSSQPSSSDNVPFRGREIVGYDDIL